MATLEERSLANKERAGKSITSSLKELAPHIEKLELQIAETRKMPFSTPKQKMKLEARLNEIASGFYDDWVEMFKPVLEKHYKLSLNKSVQGAADEFGEKVQKAKFKKRENIKSIDLSFVFDNMRRVVHSIVAVEMAYHRRKLAVNLLFAKEEDAN